MANTRGEGASIFRQSAMSRIASSDDLDKYLKVTNPSAWMVLLAAGLLIAGLIVWSATAVIPTTKTTTGILEGSTITCWVDPETAGKIKDGGVVAEVFDTRVKDIEVAEFPQSASEVKRSVGTDYESEVLGLSDWNYRVTLTPRDLADYQAAGMHLVPVEITVSETRPLDLILGTNK